MNTLLEPPAPRDDILGGREITARGREICEGSDLVKVAQELMRKAQLANADVRPPADRRF